MRILSAAILAAALGACATTPAADVPASYAKTEATRAIIVPFFTQFCTHKDVRGAFTTYVAPGYIQHNPRALDGRDSAIAFLEGYFGANPELTCDIKRIMVDGDLAAIHQHIKTSPKDPGIAVVDILRVENGKIVEHWDVVTKVPTDAVNPHPLF